MYKAENGELCLHGIDVFLAKVFIEETSIKTGYSIKGIDFLLIYSF